MILGKKAYLSRTGVDEKQFIDRESDSSTDSDVMKVIYQKAQMKLEVRKRL